MPRLIHFMTLAVSLVLPNQLWSAEPIVVNLWPDVAPGETGSIGEEHLMPTKGNEVKRLTDVSKPTITIYQPAKANGTAVIVAPGGGYSILAIEHEGSDVCKWLNSLGVTAVLLKYRVPQRPGQMPGNRAAIQDAQRAISIVRERASSWGIDPNRIGMLGFSAGGNLTAWTCCHDEKEYDLVDKTSTVSFKPNFAVLVYPWELINKTGELKPTFKVDKSTPPMCFIHASNDGISSENSVQLYAALKKAGVPSEMHLYASGGHGFGMNKTGQPSASWPDRVGDWMTARGLLGKK